jgi:hypothetical protein
MTDKATQFVGGEKFANYSREWIENSDKIQFTDEQWAILVDYCSGSLDEEEYEADLLYAIKNIDRLEADSKMYDQAYLEIHGKTREERRDK